MNKQQAQVFTTLPRVSGALSMFGSFWICFEILSNKKKRSTVQQRLILGMGMTDFITSLTYVLGTAPHPVDAGGNGNQATCDAQGFFGQFVPSTAIYNACLALYYLYTIKYGWNERRLKKLEWSCHLSSLLFPIITGIICIQLELFNPAFVHCWIADSPKGCTHDPTVECTRGNGELAVLLGWLFYYIPVWVCGFGIATVSMAMVYLHVRQTEQASQKYSMGNSSAMRMDFSGSIQDVGADNSANKKIKEKREQLQLSRRVAVQGMWYLGAFYITWFWPTVTTIFESVGIYKYWILVLLAITLPLQGFLNWIIYIRPRFLRYMKKHPEWNPFYAMFRAVTRPCLKQKDEDDDLGETKMIQSRNASSANGALVMSGVENGTSQLGSIAEQPGQD